MGLVRTTDDFLAGLPNDGASWKFQVSHTPHHGADGIHYSVIDHSVLAVVYEAETKMAGEAIDIGMVAKSVS